MTRARSWIARALAAELAVLVATGVALYFRYVPEATFQWDTVFGVDSTLKASRLLRAAHRMTSYLLLVTAVATVVLSTLHPRRRSTIAVAAALTVVALAASFTGFLLPWDQLALWAVTIGTRFRGYTWLFGDDRLRFVIIGNREIGLPTLRRWFIVHLALALPATALVTLTWQRIRGPRASEPEPADEPALWR